MGLKVPAHAEVQRQPRYRTPIVLEIRADLRIVGLDSRISILPVHLVGTAIIVRERIYVPAAVVTDEGIRIEEMRRLIVPLDVVVLQPFECDAHLEDVIAAGVETGVGQVIAESQTLLGEVLNAQVTPDASERRAAAARR